MRATFPDFIRSCWLQMVAALRVQGAAIPVIGPRETVQAIRDRRASIARYGDGELEIMIGRGIYFQEYDPELARRLRTVLRSAAPQFLVGIPNFDARGAQALDVGHLSSAYDELVQKK
jgi:hypothetical protein